MPNLNHVNSSLPRAGGARYLRRSAVAKKIGVSVRTVERWAIDGGGPPFAVIGRITVYPEDALDDWLRSRLVTSTSAETVAAKGKAA